eukprot:1157531-Pelagomonas_calceolata.AAC.7
MGETGQTSPEEWLMELTDTASKGVPQAGEGTRSSLLKPGGQGQGQGAWVRRLSEPMEVSGEDTTDETMEGGGE